MLAVVASNTLDGAELCCLLKGLCSWPHLWLMQALQLMLMVYVELMQMVMGKSDGSGDVRCCRPRGAVMKIPIVVLPGDAMLQLCNRNKDSYIISFYVV